MERTEKRTSGAVDRALNEMKRYERGVALAIARPLKYMYHRRKSQRVHFW
jgi:hypothetical protein